MTLKLNIAPAAAAAALAGHPLLVHAQAGHMMGGGGWHGGWLGTNSGVWIPILLVVIVGLLAWIVIQKRK